MLSKEHTLILLNTMNYAPHTTLTKTFTNQNKMKFTSLRIKLVIFHLFRL